MRHPRIVFGVLAVAGASVVLTHAQTPLARESLGPGLTVSVFVTHAPGDAGRRFIVRQTGFIMVQRDGQSPTTFLDITPVWEKKVAAMEAMGAQSYLRQYYSERAEHRANHARRISGRAGIRYAEAFQRELPVVVDAL